MRNSLVLKRIYIYFKLDLCEISFMDIYYQKSCSDKSVFEVLVLRYVIKSQLT